MQRGFPPPMGERFARKISRIEPLNLVGTPRRGVPAPFRGGTLVHVLICGAMLRSRDCAAGRGAGISARCPYPCCAKACAVGTPRRGVPAPFRGGMIVRVLICGAMLP